MPPIRLQSTHTGDTHETGPLNHWRQPWHRRSHRRVGRSTRLGCGRELRQPCLGCSKRGATNSRRGWHGDCRASGCGRRSANLAHVCRSRQPTGAPLRPRQQRRRGGCDRQGGGSKLGQMGAHDAHQCVGLVRLRPRSGEAHEHRTRRFGWQHRQRVECGGSLGRTQPIRRLRRSQKRHRRFHDWFSQRGGQRGHSRQRSAARLD